MQDAPDDVPDDGSADDSDPISTLLAKVLAAPPLDQAATLGQLCARHPAYAPALQLAYGSLQQFDLLHVAHIGEDPAPSLSTQSALPRTLGPFRLLELLGAGAMGAVYRAEDLELKRPVALKLIRSDLLASTRTQNRFQRESAALARLDHPGLCTAYRAGTTDGQPWIAMRLVRGTTLAQQIEARRSATTGRQGAGGGQRRSAQTRRATQHTVHLFAKIARALATAHAVGVVHRDLKPANIVLTADDEPVVVDFGLVHLVDSDSHLTISGDHIGTPAYMAPEQVAADGRDVAPTTDIYALGVTMFEALTLQSPYEAKGREDLFTCIVRGRRRQLRQVDKSLPADLELVLERALELEPARRYASMNEFADDLQRFLAHEPLLATQPSAWYRLRKLVRRHPGSIAAGIAVFATAVVGAVVALQFALRAQSKVREFDQLAGVLLHEDTAAAEQGLYPAWPHKIQAMEQWLRDDAGKLLAMQPDIERTVRDLEARALPPTAAEQEADRRSHPRYEELESMAQRVAALRHQRALRQAVDEPDTELAAAEQAMADLTAEVDRRRTWRFGTTPEAVSAQFLHRRLTELLANLDSLEHKQMTDVAQRLSWAKSIQELSRNHPNARHAWTEARAAIARADGVVASRLYAGKSIALRDADIIGLVPIGMNPVTKLWEFYDLRSAWDGKRDPRAIPIPAHEANGSIAVTGETGIVFVLLPGGTFLMGAQKVDPNGPNHDPDAWADETPHEVTLAPFFLARHELTQGQWSRLWTWDDREREPSRDKAGQTNHLGGLITPAHPVELVSPSMCELLLTRHGMVLPTEAQWEYACRGGTTAPFLVPRERLVEVANLCDSTAQEHSAGIKFEAWRDGHVTHAPVGSFAPNEFGLYDMQGNVGEMCRDWYGDYGSERAGDGLRTGSRPPLRCGRGSSFFLPADYARSADRNTMAPLVRIFDLGTRPARLLQPLD